MSNTSIDNLKILSVTAKAEAQMELIKNGFSWSEAENRFVGILSCGEWGDFRAEVSLPEDFPFALPSVFINRKTLKARIPHVERNGKLCVAPNTGILIDAAKPESIIRETLERARQILINGFTEKNREDFLEEFLAYWNPSEDITSICSAGKSSRVISLTTFARREKMVTLVADDFESAQSWTMQMDTKCGKREEAFFLFAETAFYPPDFEQALYNGEIDQWLPLIISKESLKAFKLWLVETRLPATTILSLPVKNESERMLIGVKFEQITGNEAEKARKGFSTLSRVPALLAIRRARKTKATKMNVERFDPSYIMPRGGTTENLFAKTIALIGCGSIGSHLATKLAALGVGTLRLIDNQVLEAENIHRHALGVADIGTNKAAGVAKFINRNYPHLITECRTEQIQDLIEQRPEFITDSDLVLIALGDETLELRLNDSLNLAMKRIHVWVEPLSIGGHLLLTGLEQVGCYRCLFIDDPVLGLYNQTAFAAPGQSFQKSFSGCAGVFTPFSAVDADRAANEAATLAARVLLGKEVKNSIISWRGYDEDFTGAGYYLSNRGKMFKTGERRIEFEFLNQNCPQCGASH